MIEPHHAARLGLCAWFQQEDRASVERALDTMRSLGARHMRVQLDEQELAGETWLGWLLDRLSAELEVLPSLDVNSAGHSQSRIRGFLGAHGRYFRALELRVLNADLGAATEMVREASDHGKHVVLGLHGEGHMAQLDALARHGALDHVAAIGLCAPDACETATLDEQLQAAARIARNANPRVETWITQAGFSTWRHEVARQARMFVDAVSSCADRIYWRELTDRSGTDPRDEDAHFGLEDVSGQPKLLARLLAGGVTQVERVVAQTRMAACGGAGARPVLVTGGAGFIGANLADRLASDGHEVVIYDALARPGVERNLRWLARRHPSRIAFVLGDMRDETALSGAAASASAVFHLAGQVAVTTSMLDPLSDFDVNARGTVALLDALRCGNPQAPLIFASTNKVYGDLSDIELVRDGDCYLPQHAELRGRGIGEARPLCFHTPYGCSKGTADQYVLDYAHSFGLRTAVLRMSCIYGERQLGTEDQGWVAHFLLRAMAGEPLTIYGDGRQVRDVLHVGDAVDAYMSAWANIDRVAGRAYNLGGGPANAISLLQLVEHMEALLGRRVDVDFSAWRPGDQRYFVADTTAIRRDLCLSTPLDWRSGLARLAEHFGALGKPAHVKEAAL